MAKKTEKQVNKAKPRCAAIAARGIETSRDYLGMMSALMSDIIEERIDVPQANSLCRVGATLLRTVELQYKYGTKGRDGQVLVLAPRAESANGVKSHELHRGD